MTSRAFFGSQDETTPAAWRQGESLSRGRLAADAQALAETLPDQPFVLNHCEDRYAFAVGLAAALLRKQVSLFPSSRAPQVLEQLAADFPGVYCLTDENEMVPAMPMASFPGSTGETLSPSGLQFPADQLTAIAFTSGSTGKPKTYRKHWGGFVREAQVAGNALKLVAESGEPVVATVPSQHMYGFMTAVVMPLQWGYQLGADRPFYPEDIRQSLLARAAPALLVTTPVQIRACVLEQTALPPLRFILSSTAPLHASMAAAAEAAFGAPVQEFYGSTETGAIAIRRQAETDVWRTFDDVSVVDGDEGLEVHSPYFYQSPMVLGDSVEVLGTREFRLHGRNADLVKIGGKRILVSDLNHQLLAVEGVEDGAFFLPDVDASGREPRLTAFVVAPGLDRETIMARLRERIDPVFLPRPLHLVEALPRNETGKLPRQNLSRLLSDVTAS